MTQAKQREIALQAARSQLRRIGIAPETMQASDAHKVLDDLARQDATLVASQWYSSASQSQMVLFYREWNKWRQQYKTMLCV